MTDSSWPDRLDPDIRVYLRPVGLLRGPDARLAVESAQALRLAGGFLAFNSCEVIARAAGRKDIHRWHVPVPVILDRLEASTDGHSQALRKQLSRLTASRPPLDRGENQDPVEFARPLIMAIVNATPDSFSGDGLFRRPDEAVAQGLKMVEQGADIIDIGGESTRPGAKPVTVDEELERVVPTIEGLSQCGKPISIDSRNAAVMNAALDAGAAIINDISALSHDPEALAVAAASGAPVMIMHCQGLPGTMQNDPHYDDVVLDVYDYLDGRIGACLAAGIERGNIIVDPGIGFGKTARHNFELLQSLSLFHGLGCPILLGVSRKRFITAPGARFNAREGVGGSLAAALDGLAQGAHILRVHDVAETVRAGKIWGAIADSG